jgi:hypothetical protein
MARDRRRSRARRCVGERQARRAASRCPRRLVVDGRRPSRNCRANTTLNEAEARLSADLGHRKIRLVCSGDVHLLKVSALRSPSLSDPLDSTRLRDNPGARPNVPRTRLRERTTRARDLQHMGAQPLVATTLARSASPCSARDWCGARCSRARGSSSQRRSRGASSVPSSPTRPTLSWLTTTTRPSGIWTASRGCARRRRGSSSSDARRISRAAAGSARAPPS